MPNTAYIDRHTGTNQLIESTAIGPFRHPFGIVETTDSTSPFTVSEASAAHESHGRNPRVALVRAEKRHPSVP
jgi:hypothetical protein